MGLANGKDKTYYEIEIKRVETALSKTISEKLKRDYGKYLKKLQRERERLINGYLGKQLEIVRHSQLIMIFHQIQRARLVTSVECPSPP